MPYFTYSIRTYFTLFLSKLFQVDLSNVEQCSIVHFNEVKLLITMFSSKLKNGMNQSEYGNQLSMHWNNIRNPIYIFFCLELPNHWQNRTDNNPFGHEKVLSERNEAT